MSPSLPESESESLPHLCRRSLQESWRVSASLRRLSSAEYTATLADLRGALAHALQPAALSELSDLADIAEFESRCGKFGPPDAAAASDHGGAGGSARSSPRRQPRDQNALANDEATAFHALAAGDVRRLCEALSHMPTLAALSAPHLNAIFLVRV